MTINRAQRIILAQNIGIDDIFDKTFVNGLYKSRYVYPNGRFTSGGYIVESIRGAKNILPEPKPIINRFEME